MEASSSVSLVQKRIVALVFRKKKHMGFKQYFPAFLDSIID